MISSNCAMVRCYSHRSREKMERVLGYKPREFYSFFKKGHRWEVPIDKLPTVLGIKGIKKSRWSDDLMECICWIVMIYLITL